MYAFEFQREWFEGLCDIMSRVACNTTDNKGPDGKTRPRVRRSFSAVSLPDQKGRMIEMTPEHKLVFLCLLSHIDDVEADSSFTYVTVGTIAMWAGVGNTKAEGLVAQLRAVGIIARRKRAATSTVTTLYRTAGNWEQQAIDEASETRVPADEGKTEPKIKEPTPVKLEKPSSKPMVDEQTAVWIARTKAWLEDAKTARHDAATLDCPTAFRLAGGSRNMYASKEAADRAIALLKSVLVDTQRVARAVTEDGKWFVVAVLRPEVIASRNLTRHYDKDISVHRLPQIEGKDDFSLSCTMIRLFKEGSTLNEKFMPLFHDSISNPAGWLVKSIPQIVHADASKGFPFSVCLPKVAQLTEKAGVDEDASEPDQNHPGDNSLDEEELDYDEPEDSSLDDEEPTYDSHGEMQPRDWHIKNRYEH